MSDEKNNPLSKFMGDVEDALTTFYERIGKHHHAVSGVVSERFAPPTDVRDTQTAMEISMELPGLSRDEVEIEVSDGWLTISGEKRVEKSEDEGDWLIQECSYGAFSRRFLLPQSADAESISANFKNGRLLVTVPAKKQKGAPARRIEVKTAE